MYRSCLGFNRHGVQPAWGSTGMGLNRHGAQPALGFNRHGVEPALGLNRHGVEPSKHILLLNIGQDRSYKLPFHQSYSLGGANSTRTGESCWTLPRISSFTKDCMELNGKLSSAGVRIHSTPLGPKCIRWRERCKPRPIPVDQGSPQTLNVAG